MDAATPLRGRAELISYDDEDAGIVDAGALRQLEEELLAVNQGEAAQTPQLREEANDLKLCFTRYAVQCIGLCSLALAGIVQLMFSDPFFGVAAASVVPLVCAVGWLGTYKYTRSNRALGYELYLERTRNVPAKYCGRWKQEYRQLSWEEAMHTWRAIQPTLYDAIYRRRLIAPDGFRPGQGLNTMSPVWFLPGAEVQQSANASWRPGRYLANVLKLLHLIAWAAIALLLVTLAVLKPQSGGAGMGSVLQIPFLGANLLLSKAYICLATLVAAVATTFIRGRIDFSQCRKIRLELLSVSSCAIIWQAVVVAHYTAVERSRQYNLTTRQLNEIVKSFRSRKEKREIKNGNAHKFIDRVIEQAGRSPGSDNPPDGLGMMGYSFWLGQEAASLANSALDIHGWIANRGVSAD